MVSRPSTAGLVRLWAALVALGIATASVGGQRASAAAQAQGPSCHVTGKLVPVRDLREGSGVATSRTRAGTLWAHNDSSNPELVVLSDAGTVTGRMRVTGANVEDWEDIAVGPCPSGSCIYIGDIGDNSGRRPHITIYRVPEPAGQQTATSDAEVFHAKYPDGAHDAESLFVTDGPAIFIVTKGDPGPVALYRFPSTLRPGVVTSLEPVGAPVASRVDATDRPTAADVSPDGRLVAIRTTDYVAFYAARDLIAGRWNQLFRTDLRGLKEPRGEGVTFGRDGALFLVGEGGLMRGAGTFARLDCTFGPKNM